MTLLERQQLFASLVPDLLDEALSLGYQVTLGEAWRPEVTAEYYASQGLGVRNSVHMERLAIDINLYKDGEWLTATSDYETLGDYWCSLNALCRWGGRFPKPDGTHFSITDGTAA